MIWTAGYRKGHFVIVSTSRITIRPEKRKEFFQTIGRLLEPITQARGCLTFRCYVDATDENSSLLIGEWEKESDLNSYLDSNDFAILRGAIKILSIQSTDYTALITHTFGLYQSSAQFPPKDLETVSAGYRKSTKA